jgi:hypothetical protein
VTLARDPRRLALAVVLVALVAATAFGLWHVVVGGLIHGNGKAATFGAVLAIAAGTVLAATILTVRRRMAG